MILSAKYLDAGHRMIAITYSGAVDPVLYETNDGPETEDAIALAAFEAAGGTVAEWTPNQTIAGIATVAADAAAAAAEALAAIPPH